MMPSFSSPFTAGLFVLGIVYLFVGVGVAFENVGLPAFIIIGVGIVCLIQGYWRIVIRPFAKLIYHLQTGEPL